MRCLTNRYVDYQAAHSIYQEQQDVDKTQWPQSLGHRTAGGAATRSAMRGADRPTIRYDQEAYSTRVQRDIAGVGVKRRPMRDTMDTKGQDSRPELPKRPIPADTLAEDARREAKLNPEQWRQFLVRPPFTYISSRLYLFPCSPLLPASLPPSPDRLSPYFADSESGSESDFKPHRTSPPKKRPSNVHATHKSHGKPSAKRGRRAPWTMLADSLYELVFRPWTNMCSSGA
jgi:hypothetical protein